MKNGEDDICCQAWNKGKQDFRCFFCLAMASQEETGSDHKRCKLVSVQRPVRGKQISLYKQDHKKLSDMMPFNVHVSLGNRKKSLLSGPMIWV